MKKFLPFLMILSLMLSLTACGTAQSGSEPESTAQSPEESSAQAAPEAPEQDNSWQFDSPENHQMDPEVFEALHQALPGSGIHTMVTVKDGVIIDEYYGDGYDENSLFELYSASKSFTGALIGIAIDEGYIGGVDDRVSDYLPEVLEQEDTRKHDLTLRHLLTQTSGLEWYEWGSGYSNWTEFRSADNWVDYILSRALIHDPGTVFNYSTGNTHLLSAVLQSATGMTQEEYCRTRLFDPMGISEEAYWAHRSAGDRRWRQWTCHHLPGCCQIRAALSERRRMEWAAAGSRRVGRGVHFPAEWRAWRCHRGLWLPVVGAHPYRRRIWNLRHTLSGSQL